MLNSHAQNIGVVWVLELVGNGINRRSVFWSSDGLVVQEALVIVCDSDSPVQAKKPTKCAESLQRDLSCQKGSMSCLNDLVNPTSYETFGGCFGTREKLVIFSGFFCPDNETSETVQSVNYQVLGFSGPERPK